MLARFKQEYLRCIVEGLDFPEVERLQVIKLPEEIDILAFLQ